ncbi:MAG: BamA/TamA family outer membrane protein [Marinifilaceae bacterium]
MRLLKKYNIICGIILIVIMLLSSCSTTKKLPEGEQLYVGVKKIEMHVPKKTKLAPQEKSALKAPVSVAPNNPLFAPSIRSPFPIGLWVYNWDIKKEKGFKWWLYKKLAKEPILLRDVQPELRTKMVESVAQYYGVFDAQCSYKLVERKNPKKVKISYDIVLTKPLTYGSIGTKGWSKEMASIVDEVIKDGEIVPGHQYNIYGIEAERQSITNALRDSGYYYFQGEYMEFLADSIVKPGEVQMLAVLKKGIPQLALTRCKINDVSVVLHDDRENSVRDTVLLRDSVVLIYGKPEILKSQVIWRSMKMLPGQLFNATLQQQTQSALVQLNMFTYANMMITAPDTLRPDLLSVRIDANFTLPRELQVELDVASKSNNLLGPGVTLSISNKNIFKRAENFSIKVNGSYEWQVGGHRGYQYNGLVNSYELGLNMNLSVPRILGPGFLKGKRFGFQQTNYQIGTDFLNRHSYFRMIAFWGNSTYEFSYNNKSSHKIVPFKLTYNHLLRTSEKFDSTINANPAIKQSFKNQFIPSMSYTYTYDRPVTYKKPNRLFWQTMIAQAGNIMAGIQELAGNKGPGKEIFGNIYSQFLKGTTELIGNATIDDKNVIATRVMGGIGFAYGNTKVMPYSEQFYIGGANSIRAFQIRSIGPGSYRPIKETSTSYLDQTGDIKIEANIEYRFKIYNKLYGATFVDAGNIWLLREDPLRPGGEFRAKTFLKDLALGTGAGLRYDLTFIILRLDLGVPIHAPYKTTNKGYYNIPNFWKGLVFNLAIGYPF